MATTIFEPVVAMLLNCKTNRWHPIYFRYAPLPGPPTDEKPSRHKSGGHHTEGFDTRQEALDHADLLAKTVYNETGQKPRLALDHNILWDGEDVPAMVAFFIDNGDGTIKRAL